MVSIRLDNELSDGDKKAFQQAKEMVYRLEQKYPGDPNAVAAAIKRETPLIPTGLVKPTTDELFKMRVGEIASAYQHVSDGKMGIASDSHKTRLNGLSYVLDGKSPNGEGYSVANRAAIMAGKVGSLSSTVMDGLSRRNLIVGGVLAAGAGLAAAAEPGATPESVGRAMIDSNPAVAAARQGDMCKAFGEVAGGLSGAAAAGLTLTAVNGVAAGGTALSGGAAAPVTVPVMLASAGMAVTAGAATASAVTPAAESACNAVSGFAAKLGF